MLTVVCECGNQFQASLAATLTCPGCGATLTVPTAEPGISVVYLSPQVVKVLCSCKQKLKLPRKLAGHRFQCPKCGTNHRVPAETSAPVRDISTDRTLLINDPDEAQAVAGAPLQQAALPNPVLALGPSSKGQVSSSSPANPKRQSKPSLFTRGLDAADGSVVEPPENISLDDLPVFSELEHHDPDAVVLDQGTRPTTEVPDFPSSPPGINEKHSFPQQDEQLSSLPALGIGQLPGTPIEEPPIETVSLPDEPVGQAPSPSERAAETPAAGTNDDQSSTDGIQIPSVPELDCPGSDGGASAGKTPNQGGSPAQPRPNLGLLGDKPNDQSHALSPAGPAGNSSSCRSVAMTRCPDCGAAVRKDTVICIDCGLNLRNGLKVHTSTGEDDIGVFRNGDLVSFFGLKGGMDAARAGMENVLSGFWLYLPIALLCVLAWQVGMALLPVNPALGYFVFSIIYPLVGSLLLAGLIASIRDVAFQEDFGIETLLYYSFQYWPHLVLGFLLSIPFMVAAFFSASYLAGFVFDSSVPLYLKIPIGLGGLVAGVIWISLLGLLFPVLAILEGPDPFKIVVHGLGFAVKSGFELLGMAFMLALAAGGSILLVLGGTLALKGALLAILPAIVCISIFQVVSTLVSLAMTGEVVASLMLLYLARVDDNSRLLDIRARIRGPRIRPIVLKASLVVLAIGVFAMSFVMQDTYTKQFSKHYSQILKSNPTPESER